MSLDNVKITGTPPGPLSDETCDDENTTSSDGCDSNCQVES